MTKKHDLHVPKVSVGMPVYNGGDLLKAAVDSMLNQEYTDFELIISDNASTDSTEKVCRAYEQQDKRITYIRRDRNYGMVNNGRYALSIARGEYYMAAAHDDQRYPRFISACVEKLDANPALVLVCPAIEFFSPDGTILDTPYPPLHTVGMGLRERVASIFKEINVGFNSYGMYRREVLNKIDFNVECFANDVVFLLQLMFHGEVAHIPEKLFRYRFVKRTTQEHIAAVSASAAEKHPTKLYTILTINLLRAILNARVAPSLKRLLISDALSIIALKNALWRQMLISENPSIMSFLEWEQNGSIPSTEINLVSVFASLLLPYCYPGAPYEGAIEFSEIEGFSTLPLHDIKRPGPGHQEFLASLKQLFENRSIAQALAYHDDNRAFQPDTEAIRHLCGPIESFRPAVLKKAKIQRLRTLSPDRIRVLFNVRSDNILESEIALGLKESLGRLGHEATITADQPAGLLGYDLVHVFNLARQGEDDRTLNSALLQRKPLAITALYKDYNRFAVQAIHVVKVFQNYIENGQDPGSFDRLMRELPLPNISQRLLGNLSARYSSGIIASGETEADHLKQRFPFARIVSVPFGSSVPSDNSPNDAFEREFGVKDFVLCTGPLEVEENQLMLLKALEHEHLPIVIVDGGTTAQPGYAVLCKRFKRRGPTIFTGALSGEMLDSAYKTARVYCAPGWHELAGPSTIRAAHYGCAVVASSWGCVADYFGTECISCSPESPGSLHRALMQAYTEGPKPHLRELAAGYTWEAAAKKIETVYQEFLVPT
jgi:glycosyltransferase involved in cell wall biosynthesis